MTKNDNLYIGFVSFYKNSKLWKIVIYLLKENVPCTDEEFSDFDHVGGCVITVVWNYKLPILFFDLLWPLASRSLRRGASLYSLELTLGVVPGSLHCCLLISTWIPSPLSHMTLNEFFPCSAFSGIEDAIAVTIETSKDDSSINCSETGKCVSEGQLSPNRVKYGGIRSNMVVKIWSKSESYLNSS